MDSRNGNLRVAVSRPNFDPNRFLEKLNQADWQVLKDNKPFLNRIYNACYPPGSIFKLVTLSAALETDIIQADKIINCKGSTKVGQRKFHCHRKTGHGPLSITESVAKSCNILFTALHVILMLTHLQTMLADLGWAKIPILFLMTILD
jgi:penicillin-binding protein 2